MNERVVMSMKNSIFALSLLITTTSAYAGPKASCEVTKGTFDNSLLALNGPVIIESHGEEGFDTFSLATVQKLTIDVLGKGETFSVSGSSISGGTKIDLSLDSHPNQVRAVLLSDKNPGRLRGKFEALLIITGTNINLESNGGTPWFSAASLVYNLKCKNQ